METQFTLQFQDIQATDVTLTGGKGSSLAKMFQSSIPVPQGFVVTTATLIQFLSENELTRHIQKLIDGLSMDDEVAIKQVSVDIKRAIIAAPVNPSLEKHLAEVFKSYSFELVAVRSSATSEDSDKDSWAGELETYLNTTEQTLLENIKRCWASLFSERAITYRLEKGMQHKEISVAVVVQEMVQSDVSGVCFTVHPVSGQKNIMLAEAVWGLGEGIVSGQITPDSYTYEKTARVVLRVNDAPQERMLALSRKQAGIEWHDVNREKSQKQKLDYRQIQSLASICELVEDYYHSPQDIEWAMKDGRFFIVQSRPITTLGYA